MSDQQRCPECREEFAGPIEKTAHRCPGRKSSPEKLAAPNPGQDNLVVPNSVIEEAGEAGRNAIEAWFAGPIPASIRRPPGRVRDRVFAGVIAAWARAEERQRIREAIKARATEREAEMLEADRKASYKDSPGWARIRDENSAMLDELQSLLDDEPALAALDWGEPA